MKIRTQYTCPLELVHDMTRGKWMPIILWQLSYGGTSLTQLNQEIEGITQKMLLEHLDMLVEFGFVAKKKSEGYPLSVKYTLTSPQGEEMVEALKIMQRIGIRYMKEHNIGDAYFERLGKRRPEGKFLHADTECFK